MKKFEYDEYGEISCTCRNCDNEMEMVCTDEGCTITLWCPNCGTIFQAVEPSKDDYDNDYFWRIPIEKTK